MIVKKLNSFVLMAIAISAFSCVTIKAYDKPFNIEKKAGRDESAESFIIKKDGEKIKGEKLTFHTVKNWKKALAEDWIAVDGQKTLTADISAYQTSDSYLELYQLDKKTTRFIPRVRQGKISLYYYAMSDKTGTPGVNQTGKDYNEYAFKKDNGKLEHLTMENFYSAIHDNDKALEKLNQVFPRARIPARSDNIAVLQKLIAVTDVYNK